MMRTFSLHKLLWHMVVFGAVLLTGISCSQYDFVSPTPGVLEIRLRSKNSRTDFMPFGATNSFIINLRTIEAVRANRSRLSILPDLNAIRRSVDGDNFNCLDTLARDSVYVMGQVYAPPGEYSGIDIRARMLQGGEFVQVEGVLGIPIIIPVISPQPPPPELNQLPRPGQSLAFTVNEGRRTVVNVMIDLDSTLIRRTEFFEGDLQFYVSSIQNY